MTKQKIKIWNVLTVVPFSLYTNGTGQYNELFVSSSSRVQRKTSQLMQRLEDHVERTPQNWCWAGGITAATVTSPPRWRSLLYVCVMCVSGWSLSLWHSPMYMCAVCVCVAVLRISNDSFRMKPRISLPIYGHTN